MQNTIKQKYESSILDHKGTFLSWKIPNIYKSEEYDENHVPVTQLQHQLMARSTLSVSSSTHYLLQYHGVNPSLSFRVYILKKKTSGKYLVQKAG